MVKRKDGGFVFCRPSPSTARNNALLEARHSSTGFPLLFHSGSVPTDALRLIGSTVNRGIRRRTCPSLLEALASLSGRSLDRSRSQTDELGKLDHIICVWKTDVSLKIPRDSPLVSCFCFYRNAKEIPTPGMLSALGSSGRRDMQRERKRDRKGR
jgi:hypothetical protein